jgi:precorrin-2 dehydrogenase/sirohydrochlorin ferrochelatase
LAYFPAFFDLSKQNVLLVGGGEVAFRKLTTLLDFTRNICVVACEVTPPMQELLELYTIPLKKRAYTQEDIVGIDMVVVAVDSLELQREIYAQTRSMRCLCNCVDLVACCDFTFGAYIKEEPLTIAIATGGASPSVAKQLKEYLQKKLPANLSTFLQELHQLRVKLPKGKERMTLLRKRVQDYFEER